MITLDSVSQGELPEIITRGAIPITDYEILNTLKNIDFASIFKNVDYKSMDISILPEFLEFTPKWIVSSKLNRINGIENFDYKRLTSGNTQVFDDFYIMNTERRFRFFPAEYPYLKMYVKHWKYIDVNNYDFSENDAIVMSAPFSGTGNIHPNFYEVLELAEKLSIPVVVDCAFFGITKNLNLDLNYACIESVCFSYSKAFSSGCFRAGIELSRRRWGPTSIQNHWCYVQLLSAKLCLEIAKKFSPDYIPNKYQKKQEEICSFYGLKLSDTVIFGIGDERFDFFDIDNVVKRCCITPALMNDNF